MIVYLDSSVVLRPLLAQPGRLRSWTHGGQQAVAARALGFTALES